MSNLERDPLLDVSDAQLGMAEKRRFGRLPGAGPRQALWSVVAIFFIVAALFTVFYEFSASDATKANPPAVIATPAPAARVPAPTPETTTGQRSPAPVAPGDPR